MSKIVITGGSRGIGAGIALRMAQQSNSSLLLTYHSNHDAANGVAQQCRELGANVFTLAADLTSPEMRSKIIPYALEHMGGIDALVNNAGITIDTLALRMNEDRWNQVIETNLSATFHLCRAALKAMIRQKSGRIINISSIIAHRSRGGQANYAASKGGVEALTRALAVEVASRNILINAIAPGWIDTDMTLEQKTSASGTGGLESTIPLGRTGAVEEVAEVAAFLLNPLNSYMTGQVLKVDGGLDIRL